MDKPKRILIVQLKRAGDVIVTVPVLPALRAAFPDAEIDFLVDKPFAPLLAQNPYIHAVRIFDRKAVWSTWRSLRAASYDWVVDFQSSPRSILAGLASGARIRAGYRVTFWGFFFNHTIPRPGRGISVTEGKMTLLRSLAPEIGAAGERRIYLTDIERRWAKEQMDSGNQSAVGLIPTHRRASRRWPAHSFVDLADHFQSIGRSVWFFWGPGEEEYVSAIQRKSPQSRMIPPTTLRQMAAMLEQCQLVVTNDNGPMHLAEAVDVPTITIYGPTDPTSWNAGGPRHRIVRLEGLTCLGCNLNECPFGHECMTQLTPQRVLTAAQ